ncbi:MFS transporter [Chloroflexota bacterium]
MNIFGIIKPKPTLSDEEIQKGLRWFTWEGAASIGFFSITTSGILVAYALALGANQFQIGVLAAIPFLMQIFQIPAVWIVEKLRKRKVITLFSWFGAQLCWIPIALIPFLLLTPSNTAITFLLGILVFRGVLAAITNTAWSSWQRDLIPQTILGRLFSRRFTYATISAVIFSLSAALFIDFYNTKVPGESAIFGYTYILLFGAVFLGLTSPVLMSLIPEPLMQPVTEPQPSFREKLSIPLKDANFRRLLQFLFYWSFASNLALPFFTVHMFEKLGLPVSGVIALSVLSQIFNILFLRVWGPLADKYGTKSVLSVGISLYLLVILGWIFTAMPEKYFLTIPLLIILHIFAGIANAAVTFTVGTIGLKLAPLEQSTSFLAVASLFANFGAGIGPIVGGVLASFFSTRQLYLTFNWVDQAHSVQFTAINIGGLDFLFGIAFLLGILTLGILALIREQGERGREEILESLISPMREISRPISSIPGLTVLSAFPYGFIKRVQLPGLDIALGVTIYQIAEMAKVATSAALRGRRVTKRLASEFDSGLKSVTKSRRKVRQYGKEIIREMARGAMHIVDDKPVVTDQLPRRIMEGVVSISSQSGVNPEDVILGVSQGIVQGATETELDITAVVSQTLDSVKDAAKHLGFSEEGASDIATKGILQIAEVSEPEVAAEIIEGVPEENLPG